MRFEKIILFVLCLFALGVVSVFAAPVLTMSAYPTSIPADATSYSTITATLMLNGTPLVNQTIRFTSNLGFIQQTYVLTNGSGVAADRLYAGSTPGLATVTGVYNGSYGYATNYTYVNFTPVPALTTITVTPNPATVVVGGTQQFTATCCDQNMGVCITCPTLQWTTNVGTMNPIYSNPSTNPVSVLTARTSSGAGYVRAAAFNTTSNVSGQATVNVVSGPPAFINLTAYPTNPGVGEISTLTARVFDSYGNYVVDGTGVFFQQTGVGYFVNGSNKSTQNGVAIALLSSNRIGDQQ